MFWAPPISAQPTTSFLFSTRRTSRAPDQASPPHRTPHSVPPKPVPLSPPARHHRLPRCCRTPATTSAPQQRRHERCSPPPSPHPPRPSPPLIRWAPAPAPAPARAVICPPPRPSTPRAGTGAPRRGWSLPRATWLLPQPPQPRRRVIKVSTNKTTLSSCRYLKHRH